MFKSLKAWWNAGRLSSASSNVRDDDAQTLGKPGDPPAVEPLVQAPGGCRAGCAQRRSRSAGRSGLRVRQSPSPRSIPSYPRIV